MKRGYLILVVLTIVFLSSAAWAQTTKAGVIGTKHDIGGLGCKSCHASHDGSASPFDLTVTTPNQKSGTVLLWDRNFPQTTQFGTYTSPTLTSAPTELSAGAGVIPGSTDPRQNSLLCMSCHDGLTSTSVMPASDVYAIGSTTSLGLTNDHPVNMTYNPTLNATLQAASFVTGPTSATVPAQGGLSLPGNTVQCSSCHTSHDNSKTHFLRKSNTGSALCLTCHK